MEFANRTWRLPNCKVLKDIHAYMLKIVLTSTFGLSVTASISAKLPLKTKHIIGQYSSTSAEEAYREGTLKNIRPTGK